MPQSRPARPLGNRLSAPRNLVLAAVTALGIGITPLALSHFDDKEMPQSYRQSFFAMVAMNFGPMVSMLKGEIPWDDAQMANWGKELGILATLDATRGFSAGSDKGTTRAKPEIWSNKDDFNAKMKDFSEAATALAAAAGSGDKKAIAGGIAATGKSCKSCHDEYKAENYLY